MSMSCRRISISSCRDEREIQVSEGNGTDLSSNSLVFQEKGLLGHDEGEPNSLRWQGGLLCHILTGNGIPAKPVTSLVSLHKLRGCRLLLCFPKTKSNKFSARRR